MASGLPILNRLELLTKEPFVELHLKIYAMPHEISSAIQPLVLNIGKRTNRSQQKRQASGSLIGSNRLARDRAFSVGLIPKFEGEQK
jgi:hypothetical protein